MVELVGTCYFHFYMRFVSHNVGFSCLLTTEAGGMGEGWSDAFAEWLEQTASVPDFTLGSYVVNDPAGEFPPWRRLTGRTYKGLRPRNPFSPLQHQSVRKTPCTYPNQDLIVYFHRNTNPLTYSSLQTLTEGKHLSISGARPVN